MTPKIYTFPACPISKQLFHVPGMAQEGGFTSGGVRMLSPEPGGRSVLEMQIALQVREWESPLSSWLMSMGNGQIFRVRLAPTPQVYRGVGVTTDVPWQNDVLWSGDVPWDGDMVGVFGAVALEGTTTVRIVTDAALQPGHVIGHEGSTHKIEEVERDGSVLNCIIKAPLRRDIAIGDTCYFRPWFTGTITNIGEVRTTYDAENVGHIQPGRIVFAESIL